MATTTDSSSAAISSSSSAAYYASVKPIADGLQTLKVHCLEGLIENKGSLRLADEHPGAAFNLINMEAALLGGYRKINGYIKYAPIVVPNNINVSGTITANSTSVPVNGICVFGTGAIAARGDYIYNASPLGTWTMINAASPFTGATTVRFHRYNWAQPTVLITTGVTKPYKYDGTTLTQLTAAPANFLYACSFCNYMFLAGNNAGIVTFSAPLNETDYTTADGAGQFNVGKTVVGLKLFRDVLYIFCDTAIFKLSGTNTTSDPWILAAVTSEIGTIGQDTIQEVGGDLAFLAPDGLRPISGTNKIGDVQLATIGSYVQNFINTHVGDPRICSVQIHTKSQYRLFFSDGITSRAGAWGLAGTQSADGFKFTKLFGIRAYCADSNFISGDEYVLHGDYDGYVYQQEVGYSFDGSNILSVYTTPPLTFGEPSIRKTAFRVSLFGEYEGATKISLGLSLDQSYKNVPQPKDLTLEITGSSYNTYDNAKYGLTAYDAFAQNEIQQDVSGSGFTIGITLSTNDINPSHTFKSFAIEYGLAGRQ